MDDLRPDLVKKVREGGRTENMNPLLQRDVAAVKNTSSTRNKSQVSVHTSSFRSRLSTVAFASPFSQMVPASWQALINVLCTT